MNRKITSLFFSIAILCLFGYTTPEKVNKKEKPLKETTAFYPSTQKEGFIGASKDKPFDSPADNVFEVVLEETPAQDDQVWLTYELYGVQDHSAVSRSINDQLSVGGYLVENHHAWSSQKEQISVNWLKKGPNIIRFTLPEDVPYHYKIRNLGFLVKKSGTSPQRELVINQPQSRTYFNDLGYLKGFVRGKDSDQARIYVDGKETAVLHSEFEALAEKTNGIEQWEVEVKAIFPDGTAIAKKIAYTRPGRLDHHNRITHTSGAFVQSLFVPGKTAVLSLQGATLRVPEDALNAETAISISALRNIDLPAMDMGMVNVTKDHGGYRFLPHGTQFTNPATVALEYDPSKIPSGYTEKDIKTFYFDETTRHWIALELESVEPGSTTVISGTTHFTDMINAIIKVPESPQTAGFTPTSIKDLQVASPAAGITLIEPPSASAMGSAGMSYPITIPQGRQGLEPQLSIDYNNEGGNGWLGQGWDLSTPAVTIDNRWGVPRYDPGKETETYSIDGQQLSPVAHRGALKNRIADKRFYPRVEGSFQRIIRHGNSPKNYWWEVTDKFGIRSFYGGRPGSGMDNSAVLKDPAGNIAHWALVEIRDLSDNFVRYHYTTVQDTGLKNGNVPGQQLYIKKITYTGHGTTEGKYSITFTRDRELGEKKRPDVTIDARNGFKQVTADLLRRIEVKFENQPVRSYTLNYTQGAFYKTLLVSLTEHDASGADFTTHEFTYYDDVREGAAYKPFKSEESWNPQSDNVSGNFINPIDHFNDNASAISGTKSWSAGGGVAITIGPFDGNVASKSLTVGGHFGVSYSEADGMLALIDINGDGLPDKVFDNGNGLSYRANTSGPGGSTTFGPARPITGIDRFSKSTTLSFNYGAQLNPSPLFIGYDGSTSTNTEKTYFSDINGDGLMDVVDNGVAWYNHLNTNGDPVFTKSSADTPSTINEDFVISGGMIPEDPEEKEQLIEQNPLHDVVKVWKAPFNGTVSVSGAVSLQQGAPGNPDDGVRVAIQHKGNELWNTTIAPADYAAKTPSGVGSIAVNKGDRIYFRVQSIENGLNDKVAWNPVVAYKNRPQNAMNANGQPAYRYTAAEGFILSADQTIEAPLDGKLKIEGTFNKPQTSDAVTASIIHNGSPLWEKTYTWDQSAQEVISIDIDVAQGDSFKFQVRADTNVKWEALSWAPRIYYTAASDPQMKVTKADGSPLMEFFPAVHYTIYPAHILEGEQNGWVAASDGQVSITPQINLSTSSDKEGNPLNGTLIFSVKKENQLLGKKILTVTNGEVNPVNALNVNVNRDDVLYMEYHADLESFQLAKAVGSADATISGQTVKASLYTLEDSYALGAMYRHWGQFAYNGNKERAILPINEADIEAFNKEVKEEEVPDVEGMENLDDLEELESSDSYNSPSDSNLVIMIPDVKEQRWKGRDDFTFVTATEISASRMGVDDISGATGSISVGSGIRGISRKTKSTSHSLAGGVPISGGWNSTTTKVEFMDMNGDSYPDIVTEDAIQYTLGSGALDPLPKPHGLEVHKSAGAVLALSIGGGFPIAKTSNSQSANPGTSASSKAQANQKGSGAESSESTDQAIASVGLSGNFSLSNDKSKASWMDINGDGLPDKVYKDGEVALNLGYSFAAKEQWGYNEIQQGVTIDYSAGLGVNIDNGSITAGISLSRSENEANESLMDVNGDGLVDIVTKSSPLLDIAADHPLLNTLIDGPDASIIKDIFKIPGDIVNLVKSLDKDPTAASMKVALNTGNGFAPPIDWPGGNYISRGASTGEGVNIGFTFCITLIPPVPVAKLCINPSGNGGQGASREWAQISDIDGDGYPDILSSKKDNELKVKRSTIGRTNMLKEVKRPLGGEFALDYARVGNTYDLQNSKWVLASVETFDGVSGDGADTTRNTFEYQEGYYDRHEREFYGFKTVKSHDLDTQKNNAVYRSLVQEFINDNYYQKGLLKREVVQDGQGKRYSESINNYQLKDIATGNALTGDAAASDSGAAFPALTEEISQSYEGQNSAEKSTRKIYAYDLLGNMTAYTDFADEGPEDDLSAQISYHAVAAPYIMEVPKSIVVTGNGQTYRKREADIDNATGLVTQIRQFSDNSTFSKYDMTYDGYGNLSSITRPQNADGQRLSYTYTYDNQVNTHITGIGDSYGYTSSATYDYRFALPLSTTDYNGQQMQFSLDNAGRITTVTGPLELTGGQPYTIAYEYHPNAKVPWALTKHYDPANPGNDMETVMFADGLARGIQAKKDGAIYNPQGEDQEVMIVSGASEYDAFGRTVTSYHPVTEPKGKEGVLNTQVDNIAPTRTTYDILDRPLKMTLPDGAVTTTEYGFGADRDGLVQFSTKITDANGIWRESFTNVGGDITAVKKQYSQSSDVWTSYAYNPMSEVTGITDDMGNTISAQYNWLGQHIQVTHPDAGTTTYTYDLAGNVTEKKTANLQKTPSGIKYVYDHERIRAIQYPDNPQNNVSYTYGAAGAEHNRVGRVVTQQDASGSQEFFYNPLGVVIKNVRTITVPGTDPLVYITGWSYDTWNRTVEIIYPDNETLSYSYNTGGLLQSMSGAKDEETFNYVTRLGYDKFGQRVYLSYGNGTETSYGYEPERRRLKTMTAETAKNRKMMDNIYTYDKVNNILRIENKAPKPPSNLMGGGSDYQFVYDDLYRLTTASGSHTGSNHQNRYNLQMTYNSVGAILSKNQTHDTKALNKNDWVSQGKTTYSLSYQYGDSQPHAPIHIGEKAYTYDANGNQTGWTHDVNGQKRGIIWDEENRIRTLTDNGTQYNYVYDASGERALKGQGQGQISGGNTSGGGGIGNYTIYVNPYVVVRSGNVSKHFYIESQRIATKLGESSEGIAMDDTKGGGNNTGSAKVFLYYYHPDHLGSSSYLSDTDGEVYQHMEYFPFGETFLEEHGNSRLTPYFFSGKELDEETGLYYYGARYYDPITSVWQSVDPLAEKFPDTSPFAYTANNPVNYIDPDGNAHRPAASKIKGAVNMLKDLSVGMTRMTRSARESGNETGNDAFEGESYITVYRFDTRSPEEITEQGGFKAWGSDMDLHAHATGDNMRNKTSGYVSTSKSEASAYNFGRFRDGYMYEIRIKAGTGIDVNKELNKGISKSPFTHEQEIAVPRIIPSQNIIKARPISELRYKYR